MLVMSGIAAVVMAAGALILRADRAGDEGGAGERDLSVAAVLLDTTADAGVAAAGGVILATRGWFWLDPAVACGVAVVVAYHAAGLIRKAVRRLRAPAPGPAR